MPLTDLLSRLCIMGCGHHGVEWVNRADGSWVSLSHPQGNRGRCLSVPLLGFLAPSRSLCIIQRGHQTPTKQPSLCGGPEGRVRLFLLFLVWQVRDAEWMAGVSLVHDKQLLACLVLASLGRWAAAFTLHVHRPTNGEISLIPSLRRDKYSIEARPPSLPP